MSQATLRRTLASFTKPLLLYSFQLVTVSAEAMRGCGREEEADACQHQL